jgi:hypothetical protein
MAHLFKKYEFNTKQEADSLIDALPHSQDEEGNSYPAHSHTIVHLGFLTLKAVEYDEEGNVIKEPVLSTKYSVDVLWKDEAADWSDYEIQVEGNGVHTFAGWSFN